MRTIAFTVALIITLALTWLCHNPVSLKGLTIPPLGSLLNPFTGFWQNGEAGSPASHQLNMGSLQQPVKVAFDDRLVPHIFAENDEDAYYAQGYITAQHRLWQMDLVTRAASGRLAEVLGEQLLKRDKLQRRKGMVYAATNTLNVWQSSPEAYAKLEAYTNGVNAYISSLTPKDYPIEFKLLDYVPEYWTPLKTSLVLKSMAQTLCMREYDLEATNSRIFFGEETFNFLYPLSNPEQSPVIPKSVKWDFTAPPADSTLLSTTSTLPLPGRQLERDPSGIGSNNWAVAGSKTASGAPILCNDPHLPLTLPSIWYEVQVNTADYNVYGVSLPGVPGILIGFNNEVAWGMTNAEHDVLDWYRIDWAEADKRSYYYNGKIKEVDEVIETFHLKGGGVVYDTVKYTLWGPVVYEDDNNEMQDLAMRWMAHLPPDGAEVAIINNLNKSNNYDDFSKALLPYNAPAQNFVFASKDGDIALNVQGRFPMKKKGQGRFIQEGNKSSADWQGFIPTAHNPAVKNPERGFVSSANQVSTGPDYPYFYHGNFYDFRGRTLNKLLEKMDNITIQDMMDLQNNTFSMKASDALAQLMPLIDRNQLTDQQQAYYTTLDQWDYQYAADAAAPVLFEYWFDEFYDMTWDEIDTASDSIELMSPASWRTITLIEEAPEHFIFDQGYTSKKETATDIANASFLEMCAVVDDLKAKGEPITWVTEQKANIPHLSRSIPAFSATNIQVGGCKEALNAVNHNKGPSWRMVVAFGEEPVAYGVYPGGQSGNPGSVYYDNMIDSWASGQYYRLHFVKTPEELGDHHLYTVDMQ